MCQGCQMAKIDLANTVADAAQPRACDVKLRDLKPINDVQVQLMLRTLSFRLGRLTLGAAALAVLCNGQWAVAATPAPATSARSLPPAGTTWCYSAGNDQVSRLTLKQVQNGIARYETGSAGATVKIDEQVDTYTTLNSGRQGQRKLLAFPLSRGKTWSDAFDEDLTSELGPGMAWQYHYKATASTEVIGTEKRKVGAGTYDTIVVMRTTSWIKSKPRALDAKLSSQECDKPECTVTGSSREVLWYAPAIGRAVLRAYTQSGSFDFMGDRPSDALLENASTLVVELVGYGNDATCAAAHAPLLARLPSAPWFGFPMRPNNTWEFLMARDIARE